ncbi:MAG TPA: DinB family protein [Terriglobales bacterium]|nr:DinB family protein [Terriglobales bacterium]
MTMKKAGVLGWIILVAVWQMGLEAQEMGKKPTPPKAAPSPSEAVLEQWNDIGRKLIAMAEDFPEDRYDFKPVPSVRSFAERLIHAAHANYFFTNLVLGEKAPPMDDPKRDQFKTKSDVVAFVKKSFADGAQAIKTKGDQGMSDLVVDPFANEQSRISDFAYGFVEHSGEIYGQLTVYYRAAGLVPPESRPKK